MRRKRSYQKPEKVSEMIIDFLTDGALTIQQLSKMMDVTLKRAQYSIKLLDEMNLLDYERKGRQIFWQLQTKKKKNKPDYIPTFNTLLTTKWV